MEAITEITSGVAAVMPRCSTIPDVPVHSPALVSRTRSAGSVPPNSEAKRNRVNLPYIETNGRSLREMTDETVAALDKANHPPSIFVRDSTLVRVRVNENNQPFIDPLTEAALRGVMTHCAEFIKSGRGKPKKVSPPMDVVRDVMNLSSWLFPALKGLVEAPVFRPDGTILDTPGYDPATQLIYRPAQGLQVPKIPTTPTSAEVDAALAAIDEVLCDFRFDLDGGASKANILALLLTPILRPMINGRTPLAIIEAPQQGTGKSLLAQVVAIISTGSEKPMTVAPQNEEEMTKSMLSLLRAGTSLVIFDNVDHRLDSAVLASVITAPVFEARLLGSNEHGRYPQNATIIVTGNNLRLGGDIRRRCYSIRLDAQTSKPYQRSGFRHPDLLGWVTENRGRLLAGLLTVARAWIAAGKPPAVVQAIGSFEGWAQTTGSILAYAGVKGFLANAERLDEADEDAPQWEALLAALFLRFGSNPFTTHDVAEAKDREIQDALPDDLADQLSRPGASFQKKLGQALRKHAGARFGKEAYLVESTRRNRSGSLLWTVRKGSAA